MIYKLAQAFPNNMLACQSALPNTGTQTVGTCLYRYHVSFFLPEHGALLNELLIIPEI